MKRFGFGTLLVIALLVLGWVFFRSQQAELSEAQQEIVELFGNPDQFVLTYVPQQSSFGEGQLARQETWYFNQTKQKMTFLAGSLVDTAKIESDEEIVSSELLPWEFDLWTSIGDLEDLGGKGTLIDLEGFSGDGVETYSGGTWVAIFEDGYLTYLQTLELDEAATNKVIEEKKAEEEVTQTETAENEGQYYANSDLGFSVYYPDGWYLRSGVLSNYDTDYLFTGGEMPEKAAKCDFVGLASTEDMQLENGEMVWEKDAFSITKTQVIDHQTDNSLGYGDNVVFLLKQDNHSPVALVCFVLDESLTDQLIQSLKSFTFMN